MRWEVVEQTRASGRDPDRSLVGLALEVVGGVGIWIRSRVELELQVVGVGRHSLGRWNSGLGNALGPSPRQEDRFVHKAQEDAIHTAGAGG